MYSFIEKCERGEVLLDEIDDYVDAWHEGKSNLPLHSYLGMTKSEYSLWVADPDVLPFIIKARHENRNVADILSEVYRLPIAARSDGPNRAIEVLKWLKQNNLWE